MHARLRLALFSGLLLLVGLLLVSGAARPQAMPANSASHITVTGRAHMDVVPDMATLSMAVVSEKPTAAEAENANAGATQALIQALKAQGIAASDIQTVSLTLFPVYDEQRDLVRKLPQPVLRGYRARNMLAVKIHDLQKTGTLAQQVIGQGANEFDGIYFTYSRKDEVYDKLRGDAIRDAMRQAKTYLAPLGLSLGRVIEIAPPENQTVLRARAPVFSATREMSVAATAIPIEPGTQDFEAQVQVTWEIAP